MRGLWLARHRDANTWYHMFPFAMAKNNDVLHIVRHKKPIREVPHAIYHLYQSRGLLRDLMAIFLKGFHVLRKEKIDYMVTFNPVPWGSVAWVLAKIFRKPIILGYIGADFHYHLKQTHLKHFLRFITKRSDLVTVTGTHMIDYLVQLGVKKERIFVFPHCIDNEWFIEPNKKSKKYDLINVSSLIKRKRIKDIINTVEILHLQGNKINLAVVGDGPEKEKLMHMVKEKELTDFVTFFGHQKDILTFLKKANIYVQASDKEGLSISLIEAMAAGVVPVTTIAGSEEDHIRDGYNGYFYEIGNSRQMADKISEAVEHYDTVQKNLLNYRSHFLIEHAIAVCEKLIDFVTANPIKND